MKRRVRHPTTRYAVPICVPFLLLLGLLVPLAGCGQRAVQDDASPTGAQDGSAVTSARRTSPVAALSDTMAEGFARALEPRTFAFPADHGPHPAFAIEWWYLTGNLQTDAGRRFGYQLTFFRRALTPPPAGDTPPRTSTWATNQVYLAHFALTDVQGRRFFAEERTARGAMGLAGADAEPLRVWLEDWTFHTESTAEATFPARARAAGEGYGLDLVLDATKPPVLNGNGGLSAKGTTPGNASYYYSMPRLPSRGNITIDDQPYTVTGTSWLDREWSTSLLEPDHVGWDWFALQLSDDRDLMVFQLRRRDGTIESASHGSLIDPLGTVQHLTADDVQIDVLDQWRSPHGARYPSRWRITVPSASINLEVTPLLANQELDLSFRYWEGAVAARGTAAGADIEGQGYVELVGYDGSETVATQRPVTPESGLAGTTQP